MSVRLWDGDHWFLWGVFPSGPVVMTALPVLGLHGLIPWSGNQDSMMRLGTGRKKKEKSWLSLASHEGQLPEVRVVGGRACFTCLLAYSVHLTPSLPKHPPTGQRNISCPPKEKSLDHR